MDETKKKGLVFVSGGDEVQRFIYSGAFAEISAEFDLKYVFLSENGSPMIKFDIKGLSPDQILYIPFSWDRFAKWVRLFDMSTLKFQNLSPSFAIRYKAKKATSCRFVRPRLPLSPLRLPAYLRELRKALAASSQNRRYFSGLERELETGSYEQFRSRLLEEIGAHPQIGELFVKEEPDFLVMPSSLVDLVTNDVLREAQRKSIPSLVLQSGWDNVSSKGMIYFQPTLLGVWGEQSKKHAMAIQGVAEDRVICMGSPHYEVFRQPPAPAGRSRLMERLHSPPEKSLILFGGSFRQFDETALLRKLDEAIEAKGMNVHILYRPHPWRALRTEDDFFQHRWAHVTMDPEIVQAYRKGKDERCQVSSNDFVFSMDYLRDALTTVDAVISPMSTLILESMISGRPVLAVAFNDGVHYWSADQTSEMTHFKELKNVEGVTWCRSPEEVVRNMPGLLESSRSEGLRQSLGKSTEYFVRLGNETYGQRLLSTVRSMLLAT